MFLLLTATLNFCHIYFKITRALAILIKHIHKKFEIYWIKIKGGCQSGRKAVTQNLSSMYLYIQILKNKPELDEMSYYFFVLLHLWNHTRSIFDWPMNGGPNVKGYNIVLFFPLHMLNLQRVYVVVRSINFQWQGNRIAFHNLESQGCNPLN